MVEARVSGLGAGSIISPGSVLLEEDRFHFRCSKSEVFVGIYAVGYLLAGKCKGGRLRVICFKVIVVIQKRRLMRKPKAKFTFEGQGNNRDKPKKGKKKKSGGPVGRAEVKQVYRMMEDKSGWSLGTFRGRWSSWAK